MKSIICSHYQSNADIKLSIKCMGAAVNTISKKDIAGSKLIFVGEDMQQILGEATRGYIFYIYKQGNIKPVVVGLMDAMKDLNLSFDELFHYDTGADNLESLKMVLQSQGKTIRDVSGIALDGFSGGQGHQKGMKGRVK